VTSVVTHVPFLVRADQRRPRAPRCRHLLGPEKITAVYVQESLLADCLDPLDRAVLAFARSHPRRCDDALTRPALGLSATAYYQRLLALLDRVEAVVTEPALVDRLRAERDHRRQARRGGG
jgi:Protein of unknown function (DUF3263)